MAEFDPTNVGDLAALGFTGLKQYGGFIDEEFLQQLRGRRGVETYREMSDNDPVVGAVMYVISTFVKQAEWWVEPSDEKSAEACAEAEWLETALEDMSHTWDDVLDEVLSMLIYGWAYLETVYKIRRGPDETDPRYRSRHDDGRFGWRKMELRSQDSLWRWQFDPTDGGLLGMHQAPDASMGINHTAFVPIERSLLFRTRRFKNNPEGRSLFRNAVRPWFFLKRIQEIEAIGIERDLAGLPMMEVPPDIMSSKAGPDQVALRRLLETLVQQIRRDEREGLLVPASEIQGPNGPIKTGFKLSLLQGAGKRQLDTNQVVTRYETRIAMTALAEFLFNGSDERTGSKSLVSSKTTTFAMALRALLKNIAGVMNRFAIPRLMRLNEVDPELWPKVCHGDIETPPLEEVAAYITSLANAGFTLTNNKPLERKLFSYAKLPPDESDDGDVAQPAQQRQQGQRAANTDGAPAQQEGEPGEAEPQP